ncbi:protein ROOT HAIR DEFECTIVE 3-like [Pyrus ussuriensis x Pyrus communis]|uniref:Protein ROOT HAIR DEFECTIVE 3-like n=1 Tax=Pyrus ussuriensis x Pyrus communis TaxID=2448454 RepID=A0A5N5GC27_9ROSA|nr:protein ROOT HAIR DEFECTIVE 3-like [Pyrus ussuriensis x Pyrus communis]
MDHRIGRSQTTKGIWIAKCLSNGRFTLVIDIEGTDGREQGEDDTAFERQSALFALVVSDVVLINMWCHDIGREKAANKPLIRTVFEVMMRLSSPRKTTLTFVIRDKTKTPVDSLERDLKDDIQKMWDSLPEPKAHKKTPLSECFNVEVVALPSYEEKEVEFKKEVACLRQRFSSNELGGLVGDRLAVVPASEFSVSSQKIWKEIKENKHLDLPAHKVMVATVRCEAIANENYDAFAQNKEWSKLKEAVQSAPYPGFGDVLSSLLDTYISKYDGETTYYDEGVRSGKRKLLEEKLLQLVQPAFHNLVENISSSTLDEFKEAFNTALDRQEGFSVAVCRCTESFMAQFQEGCADAAIKQADWNTSTVTDELERGMKAHVASVYTLKISELAAHCKGKLEQQLSGPVKALLEGPSNETWPTLRKNLSQEIESVLSGSCPAFPGFDMDDQTKGKIQASLEEHARRVVEAKAREEAGRVLIHMKDSFSRHFSHDSDSILRVWNGGEDVRAVTKTSRSAALEVLSVLAVSRLDGDDDGKNVLCTLSRALLGSTNVPARDGNVRTFDPLASNTWEEVESSKTLLMPFQCKNLWGQFLADAEIIVSKAFAEQANKRLRLYPWLIAGVIFLGFSAIKKFLR